MSGHLCDARSDCGGGLACRRAPLCVVRLPIRVQVGYRRFILRYETHATGRCVNNRCDDPSASCEHTWRCVDPRQPQYPYRVPGVKLARSPLGLALAPLCLVGVVLLRRRAH